MLSDILSDVVPFLLALVSHWHVLVTGGIVTAAVSVVEHRTGSTLPWHVYRWVLVGFLSIAAFLTWRDTNMQLYQYASANSGWSNASDTLKASNATLTDDNRALTNANAALTSDIQRLKDTNAALQSANNVLEDRANALERRSPVVVPPLVLPPPPSHSSAESTQRMWKKRLSEVILAGQNIDHEWSDLYWNGASEAQQRAELPKIDKWEHDVWTFLRDVPNGAVYLARLNRTPIRTNSAHYPEGLNRNLRGDYFYFDYVLGRLDEFLKDPDFGHP